ncbi:MAG: DUF6046 domain-containing protein [Flavipsychrobacter sp.]
MPEYVFDINQAIEDAFGIAGIRTFNPPSPLFGGFVYQVTGVPVHLDSKSSAQSLLNTPIVMPVAFEETKWDSLDRDGKRVTNIVPEMVMPPATIIDFRQANIIQRDHPSGMNGRLKQFLGEDDWDIKIRGVMVNEADPYNPPEQFIRQLRALKASRASIRIINEMCRWLEIYDIAIHDVEFPGIEGFPGVQPFVIDCWSEPTYEVKYKNGF